MINNIKAAAACLLLSIFFLIGCSSKSERMTGDTNAVKECILDEMDVSGNKADRIRKRIDADGKARKIAAIFREKDKKGFNGNVLISQKGVTIYKGCFGESEMQSKTPLNDSSKFQLASVTKTFTAVAILMLYENELLKLGDTVQRFFPDFPYHGVKISDLLSHRSGLPNYMYAFDDSLGAGVPAPDNATIMHWFAAANPVVKPYSKPDRGFSYNNTNFVVLASIIEKITGLKYDEYLKMAIFDPLGMKDTWVCTTSDTAFHENSTQGYFRGRKVSKDYFDNVVGDKGIYATTRDLLIWHAALNSDCLLSKKTLKEAFTPRSFEHPGVKNYGYGFRMYIDDKKHPEYIYHTGWWNGYSSLFWFSQKDEFTVIILGNKYHNSVYKIKKVLAILEGKENELELSADG